MTFKLLIPFPSIDLFSNLKAVEEKPVDDGTGKLEIWRVEDFKLAPWPKVQNKRTKKAGTRFFFLGR